MRACTIGQCVRASITHLVEQCRNARAYAPAGTRCAQRRGCVMRERQRHVCVCAYVTTLQKTNTRTARHALTVDRGRRDDVRHRRAHEPRLADVIAHNNIRHIHSGYTHDHTRASVTTQAAHTCCLCARVRVRVPSEDRRRVRDEHLHDVAVARLQHRRIRIADKMTSCIVHAHNHTSHKRTISPPARTWQTTRTRRTRQHSSSSRAFASTR
jgi:hypothetical protein